MANRRHLKLLLPPAVLAAACVPHPSQVYVADSDVGTTLFSGCALNSHVPVGLKLDVADVDVILGMTQHGGHHFLEMRLDIPAGKTVTLQSDTADITTQLPPGRFRAVFPSASLVETPAVDALRTDPLMRAQQGPTTAALLGGTVHAGHQVSDRHVWFAAPIDIGTA